MGIGNVRKKSPFRVEDEFRTEGSELDKSMGHTNTDA